MVSVNEPQEFFINKEKILTQKKNQTKKRKFVSAIVSGKAVTEEKVVSAIKEHEANRKRPGKATAKCHNSTLSTTQTHLHI